MSVLEGQKHEKSFITLGLSPLIPQGSHRLEKCLNIQDCLEKSWEIKFALESTGKRFKGLEKSLNFTIYRSIQHSLES